MNLTTQNIKENFTPHELYTILNNYLEDDEFIKPTNDYLAELQKESLQELKYVDTNGSIKGSSFNFSTGWIKVEPNANYVITSNKNDSNDHYIRVGYYDKDKTFIKRDLSKPDTHGLKIVIDDNTEYIRVGFDKDSYREPYKIEKGNKATDWSPAPEDLVSQNKDYIDLDVLNSYSIDFDDKYIVALRDDMYSTNELADCFNNYAMNEALEQYINDCTVYDDLASKISNLINPIIELKGTFKTQDDAIKVTEFLKDLGYATKDDEVIILDYGD